MLPHLLPAPRGLRHIHICHLVVVVAAVMLLLHRREIKNVLAAITPRRPTTRKRLANHDAPLQLLFLEPLQGAELAPAGEFFPREVGVPLTRLAELGVLFAVKDVE